MLTRFRPQSAAQSSRRSWAVVLRKALGVVATMGLVGSLQHCAPARQAPPDEAAMTETAWPSCITQRMTERIDYCPTKRAVGDAGPRKCEPSLSGLPELTRLGWQWPVPAEALAVAPSLNRAQLALVEESGDMEHVKRLAVRATNETPSGATERGWAHLTLLTVEHRRGDDAAALVQAIAARRIALATLNAQLLDASRGAVLVSYASAGSLRSVHDNFLPLSGDAPSDDRLTLRMMHDLAAELAAQANLAGASVVTHQARDKDPAHVCEHQAELVSLARAAKARDATAAALSDLVRDAQATTSRGAARAACRAAAASHLIELGDMWRVEAVGDADDPEEPAQGTNDKITLDYATQAYGAALDLFDQGELDALEVCADRRQLAHRYANLLFAQRSWEACGPAYEAALTADPRGIRGERAALAAVTCRQRAWLETTAALAMATDEERMEQTVKRSHDWRSMLGAFQRYVCVADDRSAAEETISQAAYARAEAFLDGGALWESAVAFRLLAFSSAHGRASGHAAQRYAEVMDGLSEGDDLCKIELQLDLERLETMYCPDPEQASGNVNEDAAACQSIRGVLTRIRRYIL